MGRGPWSQWGRGVGGAGRGLGAVAFAGVVFAGAEDAGLRGVFGYAVAEQVRQAVQGGGEGADEARVGGEVAADLVRIGVELEDGDAGGQGGARCVVVRGEGVGAGDQDGVVGGEGRADRVVAG